MKRNYEVASVRYGNHRLQHGSQQTLDVHNTKYQDAFPNFRKPVEIGSFSQDSTRNFVHSRCQLKYYKPPEDKSAVHYDLREGFHSYIQRDEDKPEYINDLLRWVLHNQHKFLSHQQQQSTASQEQSLLTDFICWRGLLTKLLCTPYENREGWQIAVTLFKKTFYMCDVETKQRKEQRASMTLRDKQMSYWGYKFEQYVTASTPGGKPETNEPVNNHEAFCLIVRSRLENHSMVFGGEVDCCMENDGKIEYIELKTSREICHPKQEQNFKRFKLIKWWAQSFLLGIPCIVCGFRDDNGVVNHLQEFKTADVPKHCKEINNCWEPAVCFNFLKRFLQFVKNVVQEDNKRKVYLFSWEPRMPVTYTKLEPDSDLCFLPTWYTDELFKT